MTPTGIEPATFRFVAKHLNHCATAVLIEGVLFYSSENSDNRTEIKTRIMAGNRSYYSVLPLLRTKAVSRTTKIRLYKTIIRPVVLYGSEAWCMVLKGK